MDHKQNLVICADGTAAGSGSRSLRRSAVSTPPEDNHSSASFTGEVRYLLGGELDVRNLDRTLIGKKKKELLGMKALSVVTGLTKASWRM